MEDEACIRFIPSRVDGLPDVTDVAVFPDRLEVNSAGRWSVFPFVQIAKWPSPAWFWQLLYHLRGRRHRLPVGDRDWFHPPPDRFIAFYTTPKLVIYMPKDEMQGPYQETVFTRVQEVIAVGGFGTFDLG
jgi:hypothetical protein